jgi:glycosyltransferase involved in cell wall biosynthesis/2-polyprenyl-3-methyl-5-hydroxy-6-metoxy-1,4-benzoquinol methylase
MTAGSAGMGDRAMSVDVGRATSTCWCGNTGLVPFAPAYLRCEQCETLVVEQMPGLDVARVTDEQRDLYGREYWFSHQERDLGAPTIIARARADLPERCLHWLRAVLKYRLPPARVLELGSAHGGFVALLRAAGFDATGLEISPWVVGFARETFSVPMLQGRVEEQAIEPRSLDLIALMDVLEHLHDPTGTIRHCLGLLKENGLLLVQTPRLPERTTYQEMLERHDRFLEMLQPAEHLYLFSQRSVREFFHRLGADFLEFEPAIFAHYDMFLAVSASPLSQYLPTGIDAALGRTPNGRIVQALLDLSGHFGDLHQRHLASEADRAARLETIEWQGRQLSVADAGRAELEARLAAVDRQLQASEIDRAARLTIIEEKGRQLAQMDGERQYAQGQMAELRRQIGAAEAERAVRETRMAEQEHQLAELVAEHRRLHEQLAEGRRQAEAAQAASARRLVSLEDEAQRLRTSLENVTAERHTLQGQLGRQDKHVRHLQGALKQREAQLNAAQDLLRFVRRTRGYRIMRGLGRWSWLERMLAESLLPEPHRSVEGGAERGERTRDGRPATGLMRVAVDLTPLVPGGANGGVKLMAVELIRQLSRIATDCELVLLTTERSHEELAPLDALNVRRHRVDASGAAGNGAESLLRRLGIDLLFCPFTAPYYFDPQIPAVSVIVDLQYLVYPQFFRPDDHQERDQNFKNACRLATRIVCISDYVRESVLETAGLDPDRVTTIHIRLPHRLPPVSPEAIERARRRSNLEDARFLIYPANFWPHKNHAMLLTAFGMFRSRYPESDLRLVCTGAPDAEMERLREKAERMGLGDRVLFLGYVPDEDFAALMQSALAMIFPSLYEGFGMPVLEAMACGTPVLCSNVTSLPEVAGDAAIFFDPRKPSEIADAIGRIVVDPALAEDLARRGHQQVAAFDDPAEMARQYLRVFREISATGEHFTTRVHGIHPDGWLGERVMISYGAAQDGDSVERHLELRLTVPADHPRDRVTISLTGSGTARPERHVLARGGVLTIRRPLPSSGGVLEVVSDTVFQPEAHGMGADPRFLSCRCQACHIVTPAGVLDLLKEGT